MTQHHLHGLPDLQPGSHGHPECSECGRTVWNDPKLAAAAIVPVDSGIVMVQRAIEPAIGKWSFPSGYVNRGEKVERAVEREVLDRCDELLEVPGFGYKNSLNVACTAAVVVYEILHQWGYQPAPTDPPPD